MSSLASNSSLTEKPLPKQKSPAPKKSPKPSPALKKSPKKPKKSPAPKKQSYPPRIQKLFTLETKEKKKPTHSLLYRGNAIDGWMSAFIAHTALTQASEVPMLYPMYANAPLPAHRLPAWKGTHVLLLDMSVTAEERDLLLREGILSIRCTDHHETSKPHWEEKDCPVDTSVCTSLQVWREFYPALEAPFWLYAVDRLSRWVEPTLEDRCLREVLAPLARMAGDVCVPVALSATAEAMKKMADATGPAFAAMMATGRALLEKKDRALFVELGKGQYNIIGEEELRLWKLPREWLGLHLYFLDNSDGVIDSSEAAYLIFQHYPLMDVFINYRKRVRRDPKTGALCITAVYSARSKSFDVRCGGFFQGQATSAGTSVPYQDEILPFHLPKNIPVMSREAFEAAWAAQGGSHSADTADTTDTMDIAS